MPKLICNICLLTLNVKEDKIHTTNCGHIFHLECLSQSLQTQLNRQCPSCRKQNIQHFQLFIDTEDDFEGARCINFPNTSRRTSDAANQLGIIIKKLDNLSLKVQSLNFSAGSSSSRATTAPASAANNPEIYEQLLSRIELLQKENNDLKEIRELGEIVTANIEQEIAELKEEIRQRNDIINSLQLQNDNLRDETKELRNANARAVRNDLIDL